uniref:DUF3967 domain-containing protein n=1 Tax=Bacillus sp. JAMB750 TaxID=253629 RepID=UPI00159ED696|nr:DUF3967 domain-containing protein [Bacillus sp. JAMB750]
MKPDISYCFSSEVAKRLSIETVTLRKYSQMLEEQGYSFKKNEKKWRQYSEDDIRYIEHICHLKKMGNSLNESVQHVAGLYRASLLIAEPDITLQEEENPVLQFMRKQEEFNRTLLDRMEQRDKNLMAAIRELHEVKKELAVTASTKKWWKFWK